MRYRDAAAFRQALEQRLTTRADGDGAHLARDRKRIAFERLLARLHAVAPRDWLLKGGFALDLRLSDRARATRDVDIDWQAHEEELAESLVDAAAAAIDDDFFTFGSSGRECHPSAWAEAAGSASRPAWRGGRSTRSSLTSVCTPPPAMSATRSPLRISSRSQGSIQSKVPAVPLERHIAEKLHAYTRRYDDRPSSRVKDLIDIVLMSELRCFEHERLREAITRTFGERRTHEAPRSLAPPPPDWTRPYRAFAQGIGLDPNVSSGHRAAAAFLDPVLADTHGGEWWDAQAARWRLRGSGGTSPP